MEELSENRWFDLFGVKMLMTSAKTQNVDISWTTYDEKVVDPSIESSRNAHLKKWHKVDPPSIFFADVSILWMKIDKTISRVVISMWRHLNNFRKCLFHHAIRSDDPNMNQIWSLWHQTWNSCEHLNTLTFLMILFFDRQRTSKYTFWPNFSQF